MFRMVFSGICCALVATAGLSAADASKDNSANSSTAIVDRVLISEAFGHLIGRNLENPGITFDLESIVRGMRNASAGEPAPMSEAEYEEMMALIQKCAFDELARANLEEAEQFLKDNAHSNQVVSLEGGKLQYMVLQEGEGKEIANHSAPLINYRGTYLDGTLFGTSEDAGGPVTLPLDQAIPGFAKGLEGMKEGEKRRIFIHPELAYGTSGHLPPNSLLTFDIEVVKATPSLEEQTQSWSAETADLEELLSEETIR